MFEVSIVIRDLERVKEIVAREAEVARVSQNWFAALSIAFPWVSVAAVYFWLIGEIEVVTLVWVVCTTMTTLSAFLVAMRNVRLVEVAQKILGEMEGKDEK